MDPAQPLQGALVSPVAKHHAAITDPVAFGGLLRAIEGYSGQSVTCLALRFGFRSTASSLLNESGKWSPDAIERALSHADANQVRAAYHRARIGRSASRWRNGGATIW